MTKPAYAALPFLFLTACILSACQSETDRAADAMEERAEQSAANTAGEAVALGMTEAALIDADLVTPDGTELGEVEAVRRDAGGAVAGLLVELSGTDPDRYVLVPITGLTTRPDGNDRDVQTTMAAAELAALPDADIAPQVR